MVYCFNYWPVRGDFNPPDGEKGIRAYNPGLDEAIKILEDSSKGFKRVALDSGEDKLDILVEEPDEYPLKFIHEFGTVVARKDKEPRLFDTHKQRMEYVESRRGKKELPKISLYSEIRVNGLAVLSSELLLPIDWEMVVEVKQE